MDERPLQILREQHSVGVVLTVVGDVDIYSAPSMRTAALEALQAASTRSHQRHLVINLREVPFMDSAGLGVLVGLLQRARRVKVDFSLAGPQRHVRLLLGVTGLARAVTIHADLESALQRS